MVQVGLPPGPVVTAPDVPEVRELLVALRVGALTDVEAGCSPVRRRLLRDLHDAGLLLDGRALLGDLSRAGTPESARAVAVAYAEHAERAEALLHRRAETVVAIDHEHAPAQARRVAELLAGAGLGAAVGPHHAGTPGADRCDLAVHVAIGEPDRERLDGWMRADVPHLVVRCVEARVHVGPFVLPGATACLRCVDAHRGERDPRHALVVSQCTGAAPAGPVPEPVPGDLLDVALVLAVRDLTAWADGRRPRTWSATVTVDPALTLPETRWRRHPGCGCAWPQLLAR